MNESCENVKKIQHKIQQAFYARDMMNMMKAPLVNRAPWANDFMKYHSTKCIVDEVHSSINDAICKLDKEIEEMELQLDKADQTREQRIKEEQDVF